MKNNIGIVCHVDFGKTTITDLAMQKAAELQNEVVVLEEKNKMQFDREVVIPITAIPDSMDRYEEPKFIDLKPFYHRFSKNHKKEEKMNESLKLKCEKCGCDYEKPSVYAEYLSKVNGSLNIFYKWYLSFCDKCRREKELEALERLPVILESLSLNSQHD